MVDLQRKKSRENEQIRLFSGKIEKGKFLIALHS